MNRALAEQTFSIRKAHEAQLRMSQKIILRDRLPRRIKSIAGVDVAYSKNTSVAAVVVFDFDSLKLAESQTAQCNTCYPYIPTLLSFREIKPTILCIRKLQIQPDIFLVDGHGYAHPYRCGLASHLGLVLRKPTIGVAKNLLIGEIQKAETDETTALIKHNGGTIGAAITTQEGCKPIYVSVGHMVSLETAIKIVEQSTRNNRIPEPILEAHRIADVEKRKINIPTITKTNGSA